MNWILAKEGLEPSRALHPRVFETRASAIPPLRHGGDILVSTRLMSSRASFLADFNMLPGKDLRQLLAVVEAEAVADVHHMLALRLDDLLSVRPDLPRLSCGLTMPPGDARDTQDGTDPG